MKTAPIAFFVFNRPEKTRQSLTALAANTLASKSDLIIFCDGPRNEAEKQKTDAVRALCDQAAGFKSVTVIRREENLGCGKSFSTGLQDFFTAHQAGIVVEDDIVLAPNALRWFNLCLEKYADEPAVFSIGAWSYPQKHMSFPEEYPNDAYFLPRFQCWGWASWADRIKRVDWDLSDFDTFVKSKSLMKAFTSGGDDLLETLMEQKAGRLNTWDIQVAYSAFKHGQLSLEPRIPYATNIGTDGEGTHSSDGPRHPTADIDLSLALDNPVLPEHIVVDDDVLRAFRQALQSSHISLWTRVRRRLRGSI